MPTGFNLLFKLVRRGLLAPAERAGLLPARHYLALALDALARDDLDGAAAALEACGRRWHAIPRVALVREQVIFRIRTLAAGHRAAAERAEARAGYFEALAAGLRRRPRSARIRRLALGIGAAGLAALAAAAGLRVTGSPGAGPLPVAALALIALLAAAVAAVALLRRPALPVALSDGETNGLPETNRLLAAAADERRLAAAERGAASALERLEARLRTAWRLLPLPSPQRRRSRQA